MDLASQRLVGLPPPFGRVRLDAYLEGQPLRIMGVHCATTPPSMDPAHTEPLWDLELWSERVWSKRLKRTTVAAASVEVVEHKPHEVEDEEAKPGVGVDPDGLSYTGTPAHCGATAARHGRVAVMHSWRSGGSELSATSESCLSDSEEEGRI